MDKKRIERLRIKMEKRKASICSQRALLYTESFKKSEKDSYILRKAKAFQYTLENMSIYIEDDSLIFGNQASKNFAAPVFPEYSIQWVIDELDEFEKREGDIFYIDEQTKKDLKSIYPYWKGKTHQDRVNQNITEDILLAEKQGVLHRGGISMSGDGHIVPDHEMALKYGFRALIDYAKSQLENDKTDYYQSVIYALEGSLTFFKRFSKLLSEQAEGTKDEKRKQELEKMSDIASVLLEGPCSSFYEAIEAVYMIHVLQMIESNGHSFCFGRFDQYMLPYYQNDIEKGILTKEDALELITHMFIMLSSHNKVRPYGHTRFSQGYPLYSNLVVSGLKPDGSDGVNDLSYLCVQAMKLCSLAEPNFSARYHKNTPRKFLEACADLIATGCGMPSMFNDEVAIQGLVDLGIPREDANDYCPIGCVETGVPGKYGHRATGMTYVNWGKVLEIMLHNGTDPNTGITMMKSETPENYEECWHTWKKYLKYYSDISVECDKICDESLEIYDADPFASCLILDSLKLGKTLKQGGCRYDVISQSNIGPSVVGNSLYTLKKLVYEEKKYTMDQILDAMHDNWQSLESARILKDIRHLPKFGNDVDEVDEIVKAVFDSYLELLPSYSTLRKDLGPKVSCYTMSTSNITSYVPNGFVVGATPDGRYAGSPLNEGCSPTQGSDINGPTAVINSVSKLPNEKVAAGQLLNMRFTPQTLQENRDKFVDFLIVSCQKGIYHNQFNVIDTSVLKDAQLHPEQYTNLIVRVAGYCAQFISLMPQAQQAIIDRTENAF
ncbi:glycyl radical protein [Floccifex sp.]|uniref:glycyl radical protein n=1 Tax=Floccifex sp. TaxID=2815810 RepID=UPI003F01637E